MHYLLYASMHTYSGDRQVAIDGELYSFPYLNALHDAGDPIPYRQSPAECQPIPVHLWKPTTTIESAISYIQLSMKPFARHFGQRSERFLTLRKL